MMARASPNWNGCFLDRACRVTEVKHELLAHASRLNSEPASEGDVQRRSVLRDDGVARFRGFFVGPVDRRRAARALVEKGHLARDSVVLRVDRHQLTNLAGGSAGAFSG